MPGIDPGLRIMPLYTTGSLSASITVQFGPFTNSMTIRRFIEGCSANASSGTTALNIDDAGTDGTGTTAIADKSAAVVTVAGAATEANNVNAADGYRLAAGSCLKVAITQATAALTGYTICAEVREGVG